MNELSLAVTGTLTMSSLEISELTGSRHDKVKQSIERMAARGVVTPGPAQETSFLDSLGKTQWVSSYQLSEPDTYIVVAQLSPEFTAKVIHRWRELEGIVAESNKPLLTRFSSSDLAYAMDLKHNVTLRRKMVAIAVKMASLGAKSLSTIIQNGVDYDLFDSRLLLPMALVLDKGLSRINDPDALTNFIERVCGGDLNRLLPAGQSVVQEEPTPELYRNSTYYEADQQALESARKALPSDHPARDQTNRAWATGVQLIPKIPKA